jgi:hypothetical protein
MGSGQVTGRLGIGGGDVSGFVVAARLAERSVVFTSSFLAQSYGLGGLVGLGGSSPAAWKIDIHCV